MITRRSLLHLAAAPALLRAATRKTEVSIRGDQFFINGKPTYEGRSYKGMKIEGLLMNSRVVQGIFDDLNPETRKRWVYPDTGKWDPERNTREFIAAMPEWRRHGLLGFTLNLQGGSPEGYSKTQPWDTSGIDPDGKLRPAWMKRLARILDRADELGMVAIVGCFYFGQDQRVRDEAAVKRAVTSTAEWLLEHDYRNVILEVDNETDVKSYDHEILKPARVHELIELAKNVTKGGRRLLVGTSYGGGSPATANVVKASDFLLLHGNGKDDPERVRNMIRTSRAADGYRPMPVVVNEDDHFRFSDPDNHMLAALGLYASWGYFDPGKSNYTDGYQCPPVNWGINTELKKEFFMKLKEVTGA
ncbi:MAG: hypothetical protein JWN34_1614 [Bryobacterales bacterium]|nr:hypothetical protein [Bryobacterales bacterium]